jgi:hypothetical protein
MRALRDPITEAEATLVEQGMPTAEIRAVLVAEDPRVVRRYLELHRERLNEQLQDEWHAVDRVERLLTVRADLETQADRDVFEGEAPAYLDAAQRMVGRRTKEGAP